MDGRSTAMPVSVQARFARARWSQKCSRPVHGAQSRPPRSSSSKRLPAGRDPARIPGTACQSEHACEGFRSVDRVAHRAFGTRRAAAAEAALETRAPRRRARGDRRLCLFQATGSVIDTSGRTAGSRERSSQRHRLRRPCTRRRRTPDRFRYSRPPPAQRSRPGRKS